MTSVQKISEAVQFVQDAAVVSAASSPGAENSLSAPPAKLPTPKVALILGSGLGNLAERIAPALSLSFAEIPHINQTTMPTHVGRLIIGHLAGQPVVCMQGRLHGYEGNTPEQTVLPLCLMQALGAQLLVVTNAAGAINERYCVGDIMLITDHINFTGSSPLTLNNAASIVAQDFDMTYAYSPALRTLAKAAAQGQGLPVERDAATQTRTAVAAQLAGDAEAATGAQAACEGDCPTQALPVLREGVYLGLRGPSFETPAEIRAFRAWGADAVGMSTVHEVIAANALKMQVLGLSLLTNMAAGIEDRALTTEEVTDVGRQRTEQLSNLIEAVIRQLD